MSSSAPLLSLEGGLTEAVFCVEVTANLSFQSVSPSSWSVRIKHEPEKWYIIEIPHQHLKYGFCKKLFLYDCNSDRLPTFFFILSSLLSGCNNKATANPPKSDDRRKKSGQLVRVAFVYISNFLQNPHFK